MILLGLEPGIYSFIPDMPPIGMVCKLILPKPSTVIPGHVALLGEVKLYM